MGRHAIAARGNLAGPGSDADLGVLAHETMRKAVAVLGELDIVAIDATALLLRPLLGMSGSSGRAGRSNSSNS